MSGSLAPALGYLDLGDGPRFGELLTPINPTSISFEAIKSDLINWATTKPDGMAWNDWFATDDGTIIAEWIAGLATFRKLAETMRLREASMDFAQLESSVFELAFNRGLLVAPAAAPILSLSLSVPGGTQVSVNVGDFVGMQGNYELYSLEGKTLQPTDTLRVAVGHLNTFTPTFSTLGRFQMFQVPLKDRYVATELESFVAGGTVIPLLSEAINVGGFSNTFLLRRTLPSQVRIYVGNGTMGWYDPAAKSVTYTCLSYGRDVVNSLSYTPQPVINATLTAFEETQPPSFDPDKETLRAIARYYPLDGRIVTDGDYEAVVRKYYGGVLYDVLSYNSDPIQQVVLLPNASFGVGTEQADQLLASIQELVEGKRGLGMEVVYTIIPPESGRSFNLVFGVAASAFTYALQQAVNAVTATQLNRFARKEITLTAVDFATQLSAKFGVKFRPMDTAASITLGPTDFLSSFSIGLVSG